MLDDLINTISPKDEQIRLQRVVLGLGYFAVELENGNVGLAANITRPAPDCAVFASAGELQGSRVGDILALKAQKDLLSRGVCLATFNALTNIQGCGLPGDVFKRTSLHNGDRVVMIGNIKPVAMMLKNRNCNVTVYDNRFDNDPRLSNQEPMDSACSGADIVIITATSIINDTIRDIFTFSKNAREVIIMGPSTPMASSAFASTPATYLAGSQVIDAEKALNIVMEGGGTQTLYRLNAMKKVFHGMREK